MLDKIQLALLQAIESKSVEGVRDILNAVELEFQEKTETNSITLKERSAYRLLSLLNDGGPEMLLDAAFTNRVAALDSIQE